MVCELPWVHTGPRWSRTGMVQDGNGARGSRWFPCFPGRMVVQGSVLGPVLAALAVQAELAVLVLLVDTPTFFPA